MNTSIAPAVARIVSWAVIASLLLVALVIVLLGGGRIRHDVEVPAPVGHPSLIEDRLVEVEGRLPKGAERPLVTSRCGGDEGVPMPAEELLEDVLILRAEDEVVCRPLRGRAVLAGIRVRVAEIATAGSASQVEVHRLEIAPETRWTDYLLTVTPAAAVAVAIAIATEVLVRFALD